MVAHVWLCCQPPILLRRALKSSSIPPAHGGEEAEAQGDGNGMQHKGVSISEGANIFVSVWNLHRNPRLWGKQHTLEMCIKPSTPCPCASHSSDAEGTCIRLGTADGSYTLHQFAREHTHTRASPFPFFRMQGCER